MSSNAGRWRGSLGWIVPAVLACLLIAGFAVERPPGMSGDTIALVHGAHTISHCLSQAIFTRCDRVGPWTGLDGVSTDVYNGIREGGVAPYPMFQYVPALIAEHVGFGDVATYRILELVNLLSFCGLVALAAWIASKMRRAWAPPLAVLVITTSPLLYYAGATFGEDLAALLVAVFAVAALRRWPPLVLAACAAVTCLTKETMFPITLLLGSAALVATPVASCALRRAHWYGLAAGVLVGEAISTLFDVFRYGQLTNFTYGHGFEQVPGLWRRLSLAVAVWIAPNGGLVVFWALAGLLVVGLLVATATARGWRARLPGLALIGALLILTGTLASWYAPFGWVAWGPRLLLPALPAVSLVVLVLYAGGIERHLARLAAQPLSAAGAIALIALALPEVNVLHAPQVVGDLFTPDRTCPTSPTPMIAGYYYHCFDHYAWARHWLTLSSFHAFGHAWGSGVWRRLRRDLALADRGWVLADRRRASGIRPAATWSGRQPPPAVRAAAE